MLRRAARHPRRRARAGSRARFLAECRTPSRARHPTADRRHDELRPAVEHAFADAGEPSTSSRTCPSDATVGHSSTVPPRAACCVITTPNAYADVPVEPAPVLLKIHGEVDLEPARDAESFVVSEDDYIALSRRDRNLGSPAGDARRAAASEPLPLPRATASSTGASRVPSPRCGRTSSPRTGPGRCRPSPAARAGFLAAPGDRAGRPPARRRGRSARCVAGRASPVEA